MLAMADSRIYRVAGLFAPVSIKIDIWGIPHIEAKTVEDAFFGQGYAAALLRLWQLDLNHRRQVGALAEVFGPDFVPFDHVARLLIYRGPIESEWDKLDHRVRGIAKSFVAGINSRIDEVHNNADLLPAEFVALKMKPRRWLVDDLLRARVSASPNIQGEVRRAMLAQRDALDFDYLAHPLEPAWPLKIPQGLDVTKVSKVDLELLNHRIAPLPFEKILKELNVDVASLTEDFQPDIDSRNGSNAWVIGPKLSRTGRPILANDPHLA
jgi:penicillin amidase